MSSSPDYSTRADPRWAYLGPPQEAGELGRLGQYRVLKLLGQGGMGMVFQAEDTQLRRLAALKVMRPEFAAHDQSRVRFLREARAAAALKHDHVVTIYQVGEERGVPFLAMEFLTGKSLEEWLRPDRRASIPETLTIAKQITKGLAAAHGAGLIHRDVKPANLWLEAPRGRVKVLDFGLARLTAGEFTALTQDGAVLGTPAFMAPEQARGEAVDARCDLFSLGCVLYRMVTGRLPFQGNSVYAVLAAVASETPPPVRALNRGVPARLEGLIHRLLAKAPGARPVSAEAVLRELQEVEMGLQRAARTDAGIRPDRSDGQGDGAGSDRRRHYRAAGVLVLVALAATVLILALGRLSRKDATPPEPEGPRAAELNPPAPPKDLKAGQSARDGRPESTKGGLYFNGRTSHVRTQFKYDGTYPLTIEATVTPEQPGTIVGDIQTSGLAVLWTREYWEFLFRDGQGYKSARSQRAPVIGRQHHVAGVYDQSRRQIRLYVNGEIVGSVDTDGQFKPAPHPFMLGADPSPRNFAEHFFGGIIHGLRISKTAMFETAFDPPHEFVREQVTALLYKFDEGGGTMLHDSSGNEHRGLIVDAQWISGKPADR